ncbi:hypothetical protein C8R45DRAFT_1217852 [Mycena sanguinolenta]|nr:hypothetical protein C8R45DRAFT_1217852 [Mycena sanguinolenta]
MVFPARLSPLLGSLRGCVPLLRRAWIECPWNGPPAEPQSFDFLNTAPSLVDTAIYNQPSSFSFRPSSHLTRYELKATLTMHRDILQLAPKLVEARIVLKNDEIWPPADEIIVLSSLRRLYVSHGETLDHIQAPALDELGLILGTTGRQYLESFLRRSSCTLRRLCFVDSIEIRDEFSVPETLAVLNSISSLIELRIIISHVDIARQVNALIVKLAVSPVTTVVAPQLSCLSFALRSEVSRSFDYGAYVEMVQSRWESQHCALTQTALGVLDDHLDSSAAPVHSLALLCRNGLQFTLWTRSEVAMSMCHWMCAGH